MKQFIFILLQIFANCASIDDLEESCVSESNSNAKEEISHQANPDTMKLKRALGVRKKISEILTEEDEMTSSTRDLSLSSNPKQGAIVERQRQILVRNAVELYTDILKSAIFCWSKFVAKIQNFGKISESLNTQLHQSNLQSIICKYFYDRLINLEESLTCVDQKDDVLVENILKNPELRAKYEECAQIAPSFERVLCLKLKLLSAVGITDSCRSFLDLLLNFNELNADEREMVEKFKETAIEISNDLCSNALKWILDGIKSQVQDLEEEELPDLFDHLNLMSHGQSKLDWIL